MADTKRHIAFKVLRISVFLLTAVLLILGGIRFSLKTTWMHGLISNQIERISNQSLNGKLKIGGLTGDLWKELTISDLSFIQQDADTLFYLRSGEISYDIWDFFRGEIRVREMHLNGLHSNIEEQPDSTFNIQQLVEEDPESGQNQYPILVQELTLQNSSVYVHAPSHLPDSSLYIQHIAARASFEFNDTFSGTLNELTFELKEGRLPEILRIRSVADYRDNRLTLNDLILESGRSYIQAQGTANLKDSTFYVDAEANPISLHDLQSFLANPIPDHQYRFSLKADGNREQVQIQVEGSGTAFSSLNVTALFDLVNTPSLREFGIKGQSLDIGSLTDQTVDVEIGNFSFQMDGHITSNMDEIDAGWNFNFDQLRHGSLQVASVSGSGTLTSQQLKGKIQLKEGDEVILAYPEINSVFTSLPSWRIPIHINNLDLSWWMSKPDLYGKLDTRVLLEGTGYTPADKPWTFLIMKPMAPGNRATVPDAQDFKNPDYSDENLVFMDQYISDLHIKGRLTRDTLNAEGFIKSGNSELSFSSVIENYSGETPSYSYELQTQKLDLSTIHRFKDFSTSLNLYASGSGKYFEPEKLNLNTRLLIDSSFVNGAKFNLLDIQANFQGPIMEVTQGKLVSEIIEGSFSGRKNLTDPTDPVNAFSLNMQLNNLQPLAGLAGAQELNATGNVTGQITQTDSNRLQFDGKVELYDLKYDSLFSSKSITGNTLISIGESYGYDLSLNIKDPAYRTYSLQDVSFNTEGIAYADSLEGTFILKMESEDAGKIDQNGHYSINAQSFDAQLIWYAFNYETPARLLSLQSPFHVQIQDATVQTDTLRLRSEGGTYLNVSIPFADSLRQEFWADGKDFDLGTIQEIIFDERFLDGLLSGEIEVSNQPGNLTGSGEMYFTNMTYKNTDIDTLDLGFTIISKRLNAHLSLIMNGTEKIFGKLDLPFVTSDIQNLGDELYEEPVSGLLQVNPVELSEFENILNEFGITGTRGLFRFKGTLEGTAGQPDIGGDLQLQDPILSGIRVDSLFANVRYDHRKKQVRINSAVNAKNQTAASIQAQLPLSLDLRTLQVIPPENEDTLNVDMVTDNFNISVFNDFLIKRYTDQLKGFLSAEIKLTGTKGNLTTDGFVTLENAEVTVPIAGIKLRDIRSEISLSDQGLQLEQFEARSGSGRFEAGGNIKLEGINPSEIQINMSANRFQVANTSDYNMNINLRSTLSGDPYRPLLTGDLTVNNGFIFLQGFGEKSVEKVELDGEESHSFSPYDSLAMDLRFKIDRNFQIRNRRYLDMQIALIGNLDVQKETGEDLQVFGTLTTGQGYVRPLGKRFSMEEGRLLFNGAPSEPNLFIKTSYIPQTSQKEGSPIILFYIIEGNAKDPVFRFESEPSMEQQNIICYTLFNKPCYALESWQQVVSSGTGTSPTDLLVGVLLDEFETLAMQELGIDVVQIDNTRSGGSGGTSIKTGWYLNRRTFFAIVNEVTGSTPKTLFILEYMLSKNIDLIITQGDDNRQGIDLRWQYDY